MSDFKGYLTKAADGADGGRQPEIRRFTVDFGVVSNYGYLREKLQTVFPELRGKEFTVAWKDEDEDNVLISSCEELEIALAEMQSLPVRKLYIVVQSSGPGGEARSPQGNNGVAHLGVVCDACEQGISGFRYKCLQCLDYDLCGSCESRGFHPEHCMLRIPTPQQWAAHHGKQLSYYLSKLLKKSCPASAGDDGRRRHSHKARRHAAAGEDRHCGKASWTAFGPFAAYLNDWTNLTGTDAAAAAATNNEAPGQEQEKPKEPAPSAPVQETAPPSNDASSSGYTTAPDEKYSELLKNIGETVSQFLDPLGINVNIQQMRLKPDIAEGPSSQTEGSSVKDEKVSDTDNTSSMASKNESQEKLVSSDNRSNKNDGWTLVENVDIPSPALSSSSSSSSSADINSNKQSAAPSRESSPALPKSHVYPSLAEIRQDFKHENPQIQTAIESLMQMGFSNEGGWLSSLVASKSGDINKVLDILQPTNR